MNVFFMIFKSLFLLPNEKEQLKDLSSNLDSKVVSLEPFKNPKLTKKLAVFLNIDCKKYGEKNKHLSQLSLFIKTVLVVMFLNCILVSYISIHVSYGPIISTVFCLTTCILSLFKIKNYQIKDKINQYIKNNNITDNELEVILFKFYSSLYIKTYINYKEYNQKNEPEIIKKKRL